MCTDHAEAYSLHYLLASCRVARSIAGGGRWWCRVYAAFVGSRNHNIQCSANDGNFGRTGAKHTAKHQHKTLSSTKPGLQCVLCRHYALVAIACFLFPALSLSRGGMSFARSRSLPYSVCRIRITHCHFNPFVMRRRRRRRHQRQHTGTHTHTNSLTRNSTLGGNCFVTLLLLACVRCMASAVIVSDHTQSRCARPRFVDCLASNAPRVRSCCCCVAYALTPDSVCL